jgi:dTDP-4-dehydrorhamnose 3,5-epimerase
MIVSETRLKGVLEISPAVFGDDRGFFLETFHLARYAEHGISLPFVQDNHSRSKKGVLRGLHFQFENPQGKLVRCASGEVFDVVADISPASPTFKQWQGVVLSGDNKKQVWIPPGYAHGFLVLSEWADFEYKCTDYYVPSAEGCIIWNEAELGIDWPLEQAPVLSEKDRRGRRLSEILPLFPATSS